MYFPVALLNAGGKTIQLVIISIELILLPEFLINMNENLKLCKRPIHICVFFGSLGK